MLAHKRAIVGTIYENVREAAALLAAIGNYRGMTGRWTHDAIAAS